MKTVLSAQLCHSSLQDQGSLREIYLNLLQSGRLKSEGIVDPSPKTIGLFENVHISFNKPQRRERILFIKWKKSSEDLILSIDKKEIKFSPEYRQPCGVLISLEVKIP